MSLYPWCVGDKSYHKALLIMFRCDGILDHASLNEVFHYWDTQLSWYTYIVIEYNYVKSTNFAEGSIICTSNHLTLANQIHFSRSFQTNNAFKCYHTEHKTENNTKEFSLYIMFAVAWFTWQINQIYSSLNRKYQKTFNVNSDSVESDGKKKKKATVKDIAEMWGNIQRQKEKRRKKLKGKKYDEMTQLEKVQAGEPMVRMSGSFY